MAFHDLFKTVLHSLSPENDVKLGGVQRSYGSSLAGLTAALSMQDAIMKHLKRAGTTQGDMHVDDVDPSFWRQCCTVTSVRVSGLT